MEVHAHTHTPRKKWTHYFWEFLMLFLAVFCGFLAENQREHYIEHQREKQYIHSMIEDLKTDTANLAGVIEGLTRKSSQLDSVIIGFDEGAAAYNKIWAQLFLRSYRMGYPDFFPTDRTIQQLKNSGGLRLIRNERAANGIISYDALAKDNSNEDANISNSQVKYIDEILNVWSVKKMFRDAGVTSWFRNRNMTVKNNYWLSTDPETKERVFNRLTDFNEAILRQIKFDNDLREEAIRLIEILKKEYHLD